MCVIYIKVLWVSLFQYTPVCLLTRWTGLISIDEILHVCVCVSELEFELAVSLQSRHVHSRFDASLPFKANDRNLRPSNFVLRK